MIKQLKERLIWLPHNLIAHPLMVILPTRWGNWMHDKTIPTCPSRMENER